MLIYLISTTTCQEILHCYPHSKGKATEPQSYSYIAESYRATMRQSPNLNPGHLTLEPILQRGLLTELHSSKIFSQLNEWPYCRSMYEPEPREEFCSLELRHDRSKVKEEKKKEREKKNNNRCWKVSSEGRHSLFSFYLIICIVVLSFIYFRNNFACLFNVPLLIFCPFLIFYQLLPDYKFHMGRSYL